MSYYYKLCSVKRFNTNTYKNDTVFFVGIYQVMSSVNAYHDPIIKKTKVFNTIEQAKQAAINNQFGV